MHTMKLKNTDITNRELALTLFLAAAPYQPELGNRKFRSIVLEKICEYGEEDIAHSAPILYNHAKYAAIEMGVMYDADTTTLTNIPLEDVAKQRMDEEMSILIKNRTFTRWTKTKHFFIRLFCN